MMWFVAKHSMDLKGGQSGFYSLHGGCCFMLLLPSADFFFQLTLSKILSGTLSECQNRFDTDCQSRSEFKLFAKVISS